MDDQLKEQAYQLAAKALRDEIKRLTYPRSMFPQQAENIGDLYT